jgi:hypothetical protein
MKPYHIDRKVVCCGVAAAVLCLTTGFTELAVHAEDASWHLQGVDTWGGRAALPAVVNAVATSPLQSVLSLRGEWEFVTRETAPLRHPGWKIKLHHRSLPRPGLVLDPGIHAARSDDLCQS